MDGISCGLIKGDCREGGNGRQGGVKEEVLQIQPCCRIFEQHVAKGCVLQYCMEVPEVGLGCLAPLGLWESELGGSSMRQGVIQAHQERESAVP